jgi:hypothetical protein
LSSPQNRRTLLTHFIAHVGAGHRSAGLLLLRPSATLVDLVEFLAVMAYASQPGEWIDTWRYIP